MSNKGALNGAPLSLQGNAALVPYQARLPSRSFPTGRTADTGRAASLHLSRWRALDAHALAFETAFQAITNTLRCSWRMI